MYNDYRFLIFIYDERDIYHRARSSGNYKIIVIYDDLIIYSLYSNIFFIILPIVYSVLHFFVAPVKYNFVS